MHDATSGRSGNTVTPT